jgi:uracil phosphoribosyltransferase
LQNKRIIIIDPMLATGGSATATIDSIIEKGGDLNNIQLTCVIAAPEGVSCVESKYPKLPILTATLDRCLNEKKYILPGLGDAGDLWTGTN